MRHENGFEDGSRNVSQTEPNRHSGEERPLWPALARGWRGLCPNCGRARMLTGYLGVRDRCASCGEELHHHRADDLPAWGTILIVGHLIGFGFFHVETFWRPAIWVHWAVWPLLSVVLTIWLLPRIKGAAVAMQWSRRLHGFGADETERPGDMRADNGGQRWTGR